MKQTQTLDRIETDMRNIFKTSLTEFRQIPNVENGYGIVIEGTITGAHLNEIAKDGYRILILCARSYDSTFLSFIKEAEN